MTANNAFGSFVKSLSSLYEKREAENITYWLFREKLGMNRASLKVHGEETISEVKANQLAYALVRLMKGEPVQYVLGFTEFFGLKLNVNRSVLIPRPETEELVEWILNDVSAGFPSEKDNDNERHLKTLDVGTGSGCIAIALKKNIPHAEVWAMDISEEALKVASENATSNETPIHFLHGSILKGNLDQEISLKEFFQTSFDIIVSNPPYVMNAERNSMHKNVLDFEPHEALFVPDDDPLLFYKAIVDFAISHLSRDGKLFFEINESHAAAVKELLIEKGFIHTVIKMDLSGKDRMIRALR